MLARIQSKKGFTLVEVIVVLIILAILAAILVPSLTGYIDKANQRVVIAEARSFLMAAQTLVSEDYGTNDSFDAASELGSGETGDAIVNDALDLAEVDGDVTSFAYSDKGKVTAFTYSSNGWNIVYAEGEGFGDPTETL